MQDLKRSNNHNLATIEDLLNMLKPIEEADENDQENDSISKHKPRFDRHNKNRRKGRGNNPFKKDGHKHDWKDCPITNTETSVTKITSKIDNVTPVKRGKYLSKIVMTRT